MDPPNNDEAARAMGYDDYAHREDAFRVAIRAALAMEDGDDAHNNDDAVDENDDENDDDDDDAELLEEEDFVYDPAEGTRICEEAMFILHHRLDFPAGQRDKSIVRFAQQFISNVQEDIYQTITDRRKIDEGYDGLDSERDTEEEVETAIRCCPEQLTRRDDIFHEPPIHCLTTMQSNDDVTTVCNAKAVSFVPLFARLAIEFNSFEEHERGGLLIEDGVGHNILHNLVWSSEESYVEEQVDTIFLAVLMQLRQSGYFVKDDIEKYKLVHRVCPSPFFSEKRFRFLAEWDPASLFQICNNINMGYLPLHWVTNARPAFEAFEIVLDAMVRFFPKWRGLHALFQKEGGDQTAFELACENFTRNTVIEVVEAILVRYSGPTNIGDALVMAAIDDNVSLDGLYFLMRRHPATMLSMLRDHQHESTTTPTIISSVSNGKSNNRNGDIRSIDNSNENTDDTGTEDHNTNTDTDTDTNTDTNNTIVIASNTCSSDNNAIVIRRSTRKRKRN